MLTTPVGWVVGDSWFVFATSKRPRRAHTAGFLISIRPHLFRRSVPWLRRARGKFPAGGCELGQRHQEFHQQHTNDRLTSFAPTANRKVRPAPHSASAISGTESMKKKTKKARPPSKKKRASAPKGKRDVKANAILDSFKNMNEAELAILQQAMQQELGIGSDVLAPELFGPDDPVDLFAEYLETCTSENTDAEEKNELLATLLVELSDLKISSNGGDPEAREKIQAIYDLLEKAIEDHSLSPIDLMLTGKIFADAGWAIPESLKESMAKAIADALPETQGVAEPNIVASMLEVMDGAGQNPFEVNEYLNSLLASLPSQACVTMLHELVAGKQAAFNQAVAGFVLHPDEALARSVAEDLAASAKQTPVESSVIERLVRMRSWLPQSRQAVLDVAIRAMRSNALPPVKRNLPKIIKCYVSVCDGSGTRSLLVTQRDGASYQLVTVMMKLEGVADAMVLPDLPKSEMDNIVRQMKSAMPMIETDLAGITRMLGLAIADNCDAGIPPPFKLVEVVENLGLGPVHPDHASPMEIITALLADLPPEQTNRAAVANAHKEIPDSEFRYQLFEAGEALEDLLYPVKGSKQRVTKLMKAYLPDRRSFWARQCAISALAMRGDGKVRHSSWKQMALVGRDIASDLPFDQIPLMEQIAEMSVRAFEDRL